MQALLRSRTMPDERDRKLAHRQADILLGMLQGHDTSGRAAVEAMLAKMDSIAEPMTEVDPVIRPTPILPTPPASFQPSPIPDWVHEPLVKINSVAAVPSIRVNDSPFARLRAVAGFGFAVARADGRIAASERKQIRAFLERRFASDADLAAQLDKVLTEVGSDVPTLGDALWDVRKIVPADRWPELYQFAVSVVDAAGERNVREVECLTRVAEELGIGAGPVTSRAARVEIQAQSIASTDGTLTDFDCREALEIAQATVLSVDLIRRQFHLLSDRFAPERFGTLGVEFTQKAAERRARAEQAARQLLSEYNEPLETTVATPPTDPRHNPDLDDAFRD
jgi:uncharacterized tellurite resistance protein B-like protein